MIWYCKTDKHKFGEPDDNCNPICPICLSNSNIQLYSVWKKQNKRK
jgi:hypothetical protein